MNLSYAEISTLIRKIATTLNNDTAPALELYGPFLKNPQLALKLADYIEQLEEDPDSSQYPLFSAAVFALDVSISQLKTELEQKSRSANQHLMAIMDHLASLINNSDHDINYWLPVINVFYESKLELNANLQAAYLNKLSDVEPQQWQDSTTLEAIQQLIHELQDLSIFEVTEHFFAQSYAMPADFYGELLLDLLQVEKGSEIAVLSLLHPKNDIRETVCEVLNDAIDHIELSPQSLSHIQAIQRWYPIEKRAMFDSWMKAQRKKGVIFEPLKPQSSYSLQASEIDGNFAQGLFIQTAEPRLCGILCQFEKGIKDVWLTPLLPDEMLKQYTNEAFQNSITLRPIDQDYLQRIVNHSLYLNIQNGETPNLYLLEIQEILGLLFEPKAIDVEELINELALQIIPFNMSEREESFKRSKAWVKNKKFTESWFEEGPEIDKMVNQCCSIKEGIKICDFKMASALIFETIFEKQRSRWRFHFLCLALWLKSKAKKNEKAWIDSFYIAYSIDQGMPLKDIPIMEDIGFQTIANSLETMQDRRTYLSGLQ